MKRILFLLLISIVSFSSFAQQHQTPCVTTEVMNNKRANDPNFDQQMRIGEDAFRKFVAMGQPLDPSYGSRAVRTIPVVVHVVLNSSQTVSDAAIQTMINQMNIDYSKTNTDLNSARAAVKPLAVNTEIQFCLAQQTPSGQPTTGIDRVTTTKSCFNYNTESDNMKSAATGGATTWDSRYYLNIWIVSICGSSPQTGGVGGYAYVPAPGNGLHGSNIDGVVVDWSIGMGAGNRTWTHEVGHYLGLHHTWGDLSANACGNVFPDTDDGFADTPDSKQANFGCSPTASCAGNSSYGDQVENYMDYSDCTVLFTSEQSNYMNSILSNVRGSLLTTNKCSATGAPLANFTGSPTSICVGQTVTFTNTSTGTGNSYNWTFQGGTPSTSTAANPTVTYSTAGTYNVTLVATNGNGNNTKTQNAYITVSGSNSLPLTEGFETPTFPPTGWVINNPDASTTWARTTSVSGFGTSTASAFVNNYDYQSPGEKDWLITPAYNFTGVSNGRIRWEYAYGPYSNSATYADSLIVLYSTNCGSTWSTLWAKGSVALSTIANSGTTQNNFTPTAAQWKRDSASLASLSGQASVRFAFKNACSYGNNIFLDNINIYNASAQQGSAPVADFVGTPTTVVAGNTVAFTDLSSNTPTNWSWTFGGGGTPNTSTTQNPTITFNTPGTYSVSLTASNGNGNNAVTKTNYITVIQAGGGQTCDTTANIFTADTATVYIAPGGTGYLSGHNSFGDKCKAQFFDNTGSAQVTGAAFYFALAETLNPGTASITATVWNADGTAGAPGTVAASEAVLINSIQVGGTPTVVTFSPVANVTGNYYIGFQMTNANGDTVALFTTRTTSPDPDYGWEQWSDNTWHSYEEAYGVGLDNFIFSFICTGSAGNGPTASFTANNTAVCAGSTVNFTSTSTGSPTSYSWSFTGGSPTGSSVQNPSVVYNTPGTYTVALTASNGNGSNTSTQTNYITVYGRPTLSTTSNAVGCYGASTGSATVTATGGTPNYTYSWSGGGSAATISNKPAGSYTVTVSDAHQCSSSASVNIGQPLAPLTAVVNASDAACGQSNGSVTVAASGGGGSYVYFWNTNATTQSLQNVAAGTYTVTVTDFAFCTATASGTVSNSTSNFAVTIDKSDASCNQNNGSAVALPNNPTGVTYTWNNSANGGSISGLAPGTYSVTATNPAGCSATASTVIANIPSNISVTFAITSAACNQSNGGAQATVTGGTSPYTYNWSTGSSTNAIANVAAGGYPLTVTDNTGCSVLNTATISNSGAPTVSANAIAPTCFGGANGSATASASGGSQPYTYNWSNGGSGSSISGLAAGTYTVSVNDNASCLAVQSVTVTNPVAMAVTVNTTNALCGDQNGTAVAVTTGGNGTYTYQWSNGSTLINNIDLAAGSYNVTVTDGNGCSGTANANISASAAPTSVLTPINGTCQIAPQVNVTVAGGIQPYTYLWSNGASTQNLQGVAAGTYTLTVTDGNGCRNINTTTVTDNSTVNVTFNSQNPSIGGSNGSITANPTGGNAPYTYSWSNGATTAGISSLPAGTYTVTITDASGCTKVSSVTLEEPNGIEATNAITFVKVFPNPAKESFSIQVELGEAQNIEMKMLNNVGQLVWSKNKAGFKSGIETVDVSMLSAGVYIIHVSVNGNMKSLRFVKE